MLNKFCTRVGSSCTPCHLATCSGTKICLEGGTGATLTRGPTRTPHESRVVAPASLCRPSLRERRARTPRPQPSDQMPAPVPSTVPYPTF